MHLDYYPCYSGFQCARLQVPLDWLNSSDTRYATIAVINLPSVVSESDISFVGSIWANPGGPGESGVRFLVNYGHHIQRLVDKPGKRHYNIVSFDPRGVGRTEPKSNCFSGDDFSRALFNSERRGHGGLGRGGGKSSIAYDLALVRTFGSHCKDAEARRNLTGMHAFINTPSIARDIVAVIDEIDNKRAANDNNQVELKKKKRSQYIVGGPDEASDVARLQYIGFSYGTVLGNYFASLFPGRVGRMVLDSVDNALDYATGPGYLTNTVDTDEILSRFFTGCQNAGPLVCPLAKNRRSNSDLEASFWHWLSILREAPTSGKSSDGQFVVVTDEDVREVVFTSLYEPNETFKHLAHLLSEAMDEGNMTQIIDAMAASSGLPTRQESCNAALNATDLINQEFGENARIAISCADGDDVTGKSSDYWFDYVNKQLSQSAIAGSRWSKIRFMCAGWPFKTTWSFKGPFTTPKATSYPELKSGRPAAPLLLLNNRLDPVTPLSAARAMQRGHPESRLVIQESMGHGAVGVSILSDCMQNIVANYFDTGELPDELESTCVPVCGPWDKICPPELDV